MAGTVIFLGPSQRYADITRRKLDEIRQLSDFMFIFHPEPSRLGNGHYERERVTYPEIGESLSPATRIVGRGEIARSILDAAMGLLRQEHYHTIRSDAAYQRVFAEAAVQFRVEPTLARASGS